MDSLLVTEQKGWLGTSLFCIMSNIYLVRNPNALKMILLISVVSFRLQNLTEVLKRLENPEYVQKKNIKLKFQQTFLHVLLEQRVNWPLLATCLHSSTSVHVFFPHQEK